MSIVETPGTLSGRPRIEGTRIGVLYILASLEVGHTPEYIASEQQYPSLSIEQVTETVDWLYDHPDKIYRLRLDDLVAMEEGMYSSTKPPMSIYKEKNTFISELEDRTGVLLLPSGQYVRVYRDALHESYTVYDIDLQVKTATPVEDSEGLTLGDAIELAVAHADEQGCIVADEVRDARSVRLDALDVLDEI